MNSRSTIRFVLVLVSLCWSTHSYSQGDGPRAYYPAPTGTQLFTAIGLNINGNESVDSALVFPNSDIEVSTGVLQYTRVMKFGEKPGALLGVLPFGNVDGILSGPGALTISGEDSGLGDAVLGVVVGLAGLPPLTTKEYLKYDPEYQFGIMARLVTPTGSYDAESALNMGSNRWALQLAAPYTWFGGTSFLDPNMTTFELLPIVTFFGENDDPFGAGSLEQDPIFKLEAHLTRNINPVMWLSLDALWTVGGETSIDGADQDNSQSSIAMGATASMNLSTQFSMQLSYGEVVERNDDGPDGEMIRFKAAYTF